MCLVIFCYICGVKRMLFAKYAFQLIRLYFVTDWILIEYISFQTRRIIHHPVEHPLTDNWFVLRDLTRPNAKRPAYRLLEEKGIEIFTPMRWRLVERKGKRIREEVPLLHDLLFAHTTRTCMDSIVEEISTLQYRYLRGGYRKPMTVGHAEMNRFIRAVHSDDSPRYFLVEELTPAMYGRMIRIEGGPLDGYEGRLLSIRGSRVKRLIVEIPGLLVAAVEVDPVYIRLL